MTIANQVPSNIKQVSRSVGYALWLGSSNDWFGLLDVLRAQLSECQRSALAFVALKSLNRDIAILTAETALEAGAGQPIAALFNPMDEASFWVDIAEPEELEAYCLASFKRMAPKRQVAFLDFVQRGQAK